MTDALEAAMQHLMGEMAKPTPEEPPEPPPVVPDPRPLGGSWRDRRRWIAQRSNLRRQRLADKVTARLKPEPPPTKDEAWLKTIEAVLRIQAQHVPTTNMLVLRPSNTFRYSNLKQLREVSARNQGSLRHREVSVALPPRLVASWERESGVSDSVYLRKVRALETSLQSRRERTDLHLVPKRRLFIDVHAREYSRRRRYNQRSFQGHKGTITIVVVPGGDVCARVELPRLHAMSAEVDSREPNRTENGAL